MADGSAPKQANHGLEIVEPMSGAYALFQEAELGAVAPAKRRNKHALGHVPVVMLIDFILCLWRLGSYFLELASVAPKSLLEYINQLSYFIG